jgi:hypothetical protein
MAALVRHKDRYIDDDGHPSSGHALVTPSRAGIGDKGNLVCTHTSLSVFFLVMPFRLRRHDLILMVHLPIAVLQIAIASPSQEGKPCETQACNQVCKAQGYPNPDVRAAGILRRARAAAMATTAAATRSSAAGKCCDPDCADHCWLRTVPFKWPNNFGF